jgi:hypothetical protein
MQMKLGLALTLFVVTAVSYTAASGASSTISSSTVDIFSYFANLDLDQLTQTQIAFLTSYLSVYLSAYGIDASCAQSFLELGADYAVCVLTDAATIFAADPSDLPTLTLTNLTQADFDTFEAQIAATKDAICGSDCFTTIFTGIQDAATCFPGGSGALTANITALNYFCSEDNDIACAAIGDIVYEGTDASALWLGQTPSAGGANFTLIADVACPILKAAGACVGNSINAIADTAGLTAVQKQLLIAVLVENCADENVDLSSEATATTAPAISTSSAATVTAIALAGVVAAVVSVFA